MRSLHTLPVLRLLACAAALLLLAKVSLAQQTQQSPQVLQNQIPADVSSGRAKFVQSLPPDHELHFSIVLPLRNEAALQGLLQRLYDPSSPDYHKFLTVDQFTEQFGPTVEDYNAVVNFAKVSGFSVTGDPPNRTCVPVKATAAQFESAFHVKMNLYQHPTENRLYFSPDHDPSLNLNVPIKGISGLSNFSLPHPMLSGPNTHADFLGTGLGPYGDFVPSDIRAAYYGSGPLTGSGQCVGLAEFDGYQIGDVTQTLTNPNESASSATNDNNYVLTYNPNVASGPSFTIPITNIFVNDGNTNNNDGAQGEVVLDIAEAVGMAPGLSQVVVYLAPGTWTYADDDTYNYPSNSDDYAVFNAMATPTDDANGNVQNPCMQLSLSWGWAPQNPLTDMDEQVFEEYQTHGQSLFVASGDWGAWLAPNECYNNGAIEDCPYYPQESPNVTDVGGTDLVTNGPGGSWQSEDGWFDSGGGISPDLFPIPTYQSANNWALDCSGTYYCSTQYRNAPDVAMEAQHSNLCLGDSCNEYPGTSFAAPRWAAFTALMNQQAAAEGAPTVGFINPAIYSIGESSNYLTDFNDIQDLTDDPPYNGYDLVNGGYNFNTGWGSPNGQTFINAMITLPANAPTFNVSIGSSTHIPQKQGSQPNVLSIGHVMTYPVTVTPNPYFAGKVTLSASGLPQGVTASFSPPTLTLSASAQTSTMTLTSSYNNPETNTGWPATQSRTTTFTVTATVLGVTSSATNPLTTQVLQYKGPCGVTNPL